MKDDNGIELWSVKNIEFNVKTEGDVWVLTANSRSLFVNGVFASSHTSGYGNEFLSKLVFPIYKFLGKYPIKLMY